MNQGNNYTYTPLKEPIPITEQEWPEGTLPLVTTQTITYMHESFIRECIEGILMQKTTFPVEIVIHDDASTDKTADIVREYQAKHPRLIKAIYQKENQLSKAGRGTMREDINKLVRGKYIALCEGDDYWTDPLKLQKQVEFLEENEEYSICAHETQIHYIETDKQPILFKDFPSNPFKSREKKIFTIEDTFQGIICHTSSLLIRRSSIMHYLQHQNLFNDIVSGDNILISAAAANGPIYWMDDIMSIYRINRNGITKTSEKFIVKNIWLENKILMYATLNKFFNYNYSATLNMRINYYQKQLIAYYYESWRKKKNYSSLKKLLTKNPPNKLITFLFNKKKHRIFQIMKKLILKISAIILY
ncbi:MAG: glycosyltransferase [Prolixibacteraceae bacterium]|nr:glycosyltransferase [Prolixibacteraceae bacterium]